MSRLYRTSVTNAESVLAIVSVVGASPPERIRTLSISAMAASLLFSPRLTSALSSSSSSFLMIGISAPRSATDVPPELSLYITGLMLLDTGGLPVS